MPEEEEYSNPCIVCGDNIPMHHTCIIITEEGENHLKCAHISCQGGLKQALKSEDG